MNLGVSVDDYPSLLNGLAKLREIRDYHASMLIPQKFLGQAAKSQRESFKKSARRFAEMEINGVKVLREKKNPGRKLLFTPEEVVRAVYHLHVPASGKHRGCHQVSVSFHVIMVVIAVINNVH